VKEESFPEITQVRQAVEEAYALYNRAIETDNPELMLEFYRDLTLPDFVEKGIPGDGRVTCTREQMLAAMRAVAENGTLRLGAPVVAQTQMEGISLEGEAAVVRLTHRFRTTRAYPVAQRGTVGKRHPVEDIDRWEETWQRTSAGWRLAIKQRLSIRTKLLG